MLLLAAMIKHKQAQREREREAGGHCGRPLNFEDTGPSCIATKRHIMHKLLGMAFQSEAETVEHLVFDCNCSGFAG